MLTWRGPWQANVNYVVNDIVFYMGSSYIAVAVPPVGVPPSDAGFWQLLAAAGAGPLNWRGPWSASLEYNPADAVSYEGGSYVAFERSPPGTLPTDTAVWQQVARRGADGPPGLVWRGPWQETLAYNRFDAVLYSDDGSAYIAIQPSPAGTPPTEASVWQLLVRAGIPDASKLTPAEIASIAVSVIAATGTVGNFLVNLTNAITKTKAFSDAINTALNAAVKEGGVVANALSDATRPGGLINDAIMSEINSAAQRGGAINDAIMSEINSAVQQQGGLIRNAIGQQIGDALKSNGQIAKAIENKVRPARLETFNLADILRRAGVIKLQ